MKSQILEPTTNNIKIAAKLILTGELVAVPTETVYGLAGLISNETTILKIFETKSRSKFDPLLVHLSPGIVDLKNPLQSLDNKKIIKLKAIPKKNIPIIETLIFNFWPGSLTIILPKGDFIPDIATSGMFSAGIRMPSHPICISLINEVGVPLAVPSANRFRKISPTNAHDVQKELGELIPVILDGGESPVGMESTVIEIDGENNYFNILRSGAVSPQEIINTMPTLSWRQNSLDQKITPYKNHYELNQTVLILPEFINKLGTEYFLNFTSKKKRIGFLLWDTEPNKIVKDFFSENKIIIYVKKLVDKSRNEPPLKQAAKNFFTHLRSLESSDCEIIFAEKCPYNEGLGLAIQDRLKKASTNAG